MKTELNTIRESLENYQDNPDLEYFARLHGTEIIPAFKEICNAIEEIHEMLTEEFPDREREIQNIMQDILMEMDDGDAEYPFSYMHVSLFICVCLQIKFGNPK